MLAEFRRPVRVIVFLDNEALVSWGHARGIVPGHFRSTRRDVSSVTTNRYRTYADRHVQLFCSATPYFELTTVRSEDQEMPDETGTKSLKPRECFAFRQLCPVLLYATKHGRSPQIEVDQASGNTIEIPVHISFEWSDGKIVREWHNFDTTEMMAELELAASHSSE